MKHLFLLFFTSCSLLLQAQQSCGFDQLHHQSLENDPTYARKVAEDEISIRRYIQAHPENRGGVTNRGNVLYTIPIVVHVMHTGGAIGTLYNPTDARILGAVEYLNQVYSGTYSGLTPPSTTGAAGDLELRFQLAARTPSCGATNGIDRVNASALPNYTDNGVNVSNTTGVADVSLKNLSRWDPASYYNIWVVNKIDGKDGTSGQFIAGYAYFAGASASVDGTVMLATTMRTGEKTLPHEIGHAFNLYHCFEGSNLNTTCPANTDCTTQGDRVCDTDPISNNVNASGVYDFGCRTGTNNPCTSTPYTINTENNYMSYTNCTTLFTNGQKVRLQAAMSLASRASFVAATNQALVPCGTVVNFSQAADTRAETGATTDGCRRYTDYTYQMTIGAAPSVSAVATLALGGTATRGLDYDITTNGNFASPAATLVFAANASAAQTFTVRVYDDANVESSETIVLNYTLNNGGGNAATGSTYQTLTFTLNDNDVIPVAPGSSITQIGSPEYNIPGVFDATQTSRKGQMLYKASELQAAGLTAGQITSLQLFVSSKTSTTPYGSFQLRMGTTAAFSYLVDGSANVLGGLTTVYSSGSYSTIAGWNNFALTTPFNWNGTDNIVLEFCYTNTTTSTADQVGGYADGGTAAQGNILFKNGISCSGTYANPISYYQSGIKPQIKLGITITGNTAETVAGTSRNEYLADGSNDYYYSANGKLLARISAINNTLGCTNVSLAEAGSTWQSFSGGQRSQKVFAIVPTQNGGTTNYTASLYFDNAELAGRNAANLRIVKTNAATPDAALRSNSVIVTPVVTTLGTGTTVFTGNFTGFSSFFLVDASVALPVTLLTFDARLNAQGNTLVSWSTSSEKDNAYFMVQVSQNGTDFADAGKVLAQGDATTTQQYSFTHFNPQSGITYYRLKQVDKDGRINLSRVATVRKTAMASIQPYIYPVPAKSVLHIQWGAIVSKGTVQVYGADMRLLQLQNIAAATAITDIDVAKLPAGVYYLHLHTEEAGSSVLKFIKN